MNDAVLYVGITVGAVIVLALLAATLQERRIKQLIEAARELGFNYRKVDSALAAQVEGTMPLFSEGHSKEAIHVLRGVGRGLEVVIFEYHYVVGSGRSTRYYRVTVVRFLDPEMNWPAFSVRPKRFYHTLVGFLGAKDVPFDAHPEFTQAFVLQGADEEAVRQVFNDEVRYFLLQHPQACAEASGQCMIYYTNRVVTAESLRPVLEEAFAVMTTLHGTDRRL